MPKTHLSHEKAILHALRKNSMPTSVLADKLGLSREAIYRCCLKLDEAGWITSREGRSLKRIFYYPKFRQVVTSENYERIRKEIKKSDEADARLIPFPPKVRVWCLSPKALSELPGVPTMPPPVKGAKLMGELAGGPSTAPPGEEDMAEAMECDGDVTLEPPPGRGGSRGGRGEG